MAANPEITRADRCLNIAWAILALREDEDIVGVGTERLRLDIRKVLGLPELHGNDRLGDLRAHGDAIGGHGLKLEVRLDRTGGQKRRYIPFTEANFQKCEQYITDSESRTGGILF